MFCLLAEINILLLLLLDWVWLSLA